MKKQNPPQDRPFIVERESPKGPHFLFSSHRIANLQYKLTFLEGQLDPLQFQNIDLKDTVIQLIRSVSTNADILRKLIPADNAALRLKLDMASFSEIAALVQQHWMMMKTDIEALQDTKERLKGDIDGERVKYEEERKVRLNQKLQYERQKCKDQQLISTLQAELAKLKAQNQSLIKWAQREAVQSQIRMATSLKEFQLREYEFKSKQTESQRCISRLNKTIDSMKFQYQQSKSSLKALYQKISAQKLAEQMESFDLMIKYKEQEKFKVEKELSDVRQLHARQIQEKEEFARHLQRKIEQEKKNVSDLQYQLYLLREETKGNKMQFKQMEINLLLMKQNYSIAEANLAKKQLVIAEISSQHQQAIQSYQLKIKEIIRARDERNNILMSENRRQSLLIEELYKQIDQMKGRIEFIDQEWDQKIKSIEKKQMAKEAEIMQKVTQSLMKIQEEKEKAASMVSNKEKQIEKIKQYYQRAMSKLQKDLQSKKEEIIKQAAIKNSKLLQKSQEEVINIRLELKSQQQNQKKIIMEQIKCLQKQHSIKMIQQENAFQAQRKKYEKKIDILQGNQKALKEEIEKMGRKHRQTEDKMQKMKSNHIRQIAKLQGKNADLVLTWQKMMDKQLDEFQTVIMQRQKQFGIRESQFYKQMQSIQMKLQKKEKDLTTFKNNQSKAMNDFKQANGIVVIEKKHQSQLNELKATYIRKQLDQQASFDRKIRDLMGQYQRQKQEITTYYHQKVNKLQTNLDDMLIDLGNQLYNIDIERQIDKENSSKPIMQKMNRVQKLSHINELVTSIQTYIKNQKQDLASISNRLHIIQSAIETRIQLRKEQIQKERIQKIGSIQATLASNLAEYNSKLQKKEEQYRQKQLQLQNRRKQFSELLYEQFKFLSDTHERQYTKLMQRYNQLEQLYERRPSRPQDIFKIKQLTNIKTKLQGEIAVYNRKLETANEIVQYLNLQLQNYKEVYDIFGPNSDIGNKTISFNLDSQKMEKYQNLIQKKTKEDQTKSYTKDTQPQQKAAPAFQVHRQSEGKNIFEASFNDLRDKDEDNDSVLLQSKQSVRKIRKYSHLSQKKGLIKQRQTLKTQKSSSKDKMDLFQKTSNFLKLANSPPVNESLFRQTDAAMKNYRKRRLKRYTTTGAQHFQ